MKQYFDPLSKDIIILIKSSALLLTLLFLFRVALLFSNTDLLSNITYTDITQSFITGFRFDLIVTVWLCIPLVFGLLMPTGFVNKSIYVIWFSLAAVFLILIGVIELNFYSEFHARLNSLAFQYLREDPSTVLSMLWYGYPVFKYLLALIILSVVCYTLYKRIFIQSQIVVEFSTPVRHNNILIAYGFRFLLFLIVLSVSILFARGTLRQGPPLRWGDAFSSEHLFANHLALNGAFTFTKALMSQSDTADERKVWLHHIDNQQAENNVRNMLYLPSDKALNADYSPVYRKSTGANLFKNKSPNIVFILMESFSGRYTGALGAKESITPNFDKLSKEGILFERFFSNGTHTHQGMFASISCFPNLPTYETLMQQPEGDHKFSGIIKITDERKYQSFYVYNGDFAWDNQRGFFGAQGMQKFIGRNDFINPKYSDPTWGVSDEDMFNRAAQELDKLSSNSASTKQPFFAFLQTLSNHVPFALPDPLPVNKVKNQGTLNEHLTAMRYSDWALGQFFEHAKKSDYYENTIFVVVGDHGFGTKPQLTDIDLLRFRIPMLIIAPNIQEHFPERIKTVGSQVDIAPTIAGLLGGDTAQSCWGRNLFSVKDKGFAVIKPSSSDPSTAIINGDLIYVKSAQGREQLYQYNLNPDNLYARLIDTPESVAAATTMKNNMLSYIQVSMKNLTEGNVGHGTVNNSIAIDEHMLEQNNILTN